MQHTNPEYGWETVAKLEAALELGLLKNRLQLTVNWYQNRTRNQLVGYALPLYTGFANVQMNLPAIIGNSGTEIEATVNLLNKRNFSWSFDLNYSTPRNKLISYPGIESSSYATRYKVGQPLSGAFLYNYTGLDTETQIPTFSDLNSDGLIRSMDDRAYNFIGQRGFGGINNSFTISNQFQFDIFLQYVKQVGYEFYGALTPGTFLNSNGNLPLHILDDSSMFKHFSQNPLSPASNAYFLLYGSDGVIGDASFLRLKNISVSYSLSQQLKSQLKLRDLKIYVQGQNLLTFTNYRGLDPEASRISGDSGVPKLPPLRMGIIGIQISL